MLWGDIIRGSYRRNAGKTLPEPEEDDEALEELDLDIAEAGLSRRPSITTQYEPSFEGAKYTDKGKSTILKPPKTHGKEKMTSIGVFSDHVVSAILI